MIRILIATCLFLSIPGLAQTPQWSAEKANDWYAKQPWLVGSNYIPAGFLQRPADFRSDAARATGHKC